MFPDLSPKQIRAIAALVTCRTLGAAARQARCGESTLRRWLATDARFQAAWRQARAQLLEEAVAHAARSAEAAALTLHEVMLRSASDSVRVQAARAILEIVVRAHERGEIEGRLAGILAGMEELRHAHH
jgi:hypothetical protein